MTKPRTLKNIQKRKKYGGGTRSKKTRTKTHKKHCTKLKTKSNKKGCYFGG